MVSRTRQKIMDSARQLYNEHGYGETTIELIAQHAAIARGNLWYHFRTQRELLAALSEEFLSEIDARLEIRPMPDEDIIEAFAELLLTMSIEFRRHRFLYRDQADFGEFTKELRESIPNLFDRTIVQVSVYFRIMLVDGLLRWDEDRIEELASTAIMVMRFFVEMLREVRPTGNHGGRSIKNGFEMLMVILEPNMDAQAIARLRAAIMGRATDTDKPAQTKRAKLPKTGNKVGGH